MSRPRRLARAGTDQGAVAVMTAVFAVVMLVLGGLAVEATNWYSTDRASQRAVDLAATSAAQFLPDTCSAVNEAYRSLRDNPIPNTPPPPPLSGLVDGIATNGEIQVLLGAETAPPPFGTNTTAARGSGEWVDASACTLTSRPGVVQADSARGRPRLVRVMSPTAEVPFALTQAATLDPVGATDVPDTASAYRMATAGIVGSGRGLGYGLMPVAIPSGCILPPTGSYGPRTVITAPKSFPEAVDFEPNGFTSGPAVTYPLGPDGQPVAYSFQSTAVAGGAVTADFRLTGLSTDPRTPTTGTVFFDFHTNATSATTTTKRVPTPATPVTGIPGTLVGTPTGSGTNWSATVRVQLPTGMATPLGVWLVRAAQLGAANPGNRWSADNAVGEVFVDGEFYQGGGCDDPNQGNFGLVRTERFGGTGSQLDVNIAKGLDHTLTAFPPGTLPAPAATATVCPSNGSPPGALLDPTPGTPVDGANCVFIETGNVAGPITQGLITGTTGAGPVPGRLFRDTPYTPPATAPTSTTCRSSASGPNNFLWKTPTAGNVSIVNSVLSCYLTPGRQLTDVVNGVPGSLTDDIYSDPRFFFVPVLNGNQRPPSGGNHYAIRDFVGGFITGQRLDGSVTCGTGRNGTTCNGIEFGSRQVFSLTVFTFPTSALPAVPTAPVQEGPDGFEDFIAGTKEVVLFE